MKYVKGGRGKKAPYQTTHCRVPEPCKPIVEKLVAYYKLLVDDSEAAELLLDNINLGLDDYYEKLANSKSRELSSEDSEFQSFDIKDRKE